MNRSIILIGRGPGWLDDFEISSSLLKKYDTMAIGGNCLYKGYIDYMATYHEKDIFAYFNKRKLEKLNTDYLVIHHEAKENVNIVIPYEPPSGSSALLGSLASINLSYDKIVLCGCPLEGKNDKEHPYEIFRKGWIFHLSKVKDKVRSMSGWTKELLKGPTEEWIKVIK